jgi:hypothetical protein
LIGSGGNIAVLPGSDGKLIIDSGFLGTRNKIAAALSSLSPDPLPSTNSSLSDALNPPVFVVLREVATTL